MARTASKKQFSARAAVFSNAYVAGVLTRLSLFLCLCFCLCPCENQPYFIDKINICFHSPVDAEPQLFFYLFVCLFVFFSLPQVVFLPVVIGSVFLSGYQHTLQIWQPS